MKIDWKSGLVALGEASMNTITICLQLCRQFTFGLMSSRENFSLRTLFKGTDQYWRTEETERTGMGVFMETASQSCLYCEWA